MPVVTTDLGRLFSTGCLTPAGRRHETISVSSSSEDSTESYILDLMRRCRGDEVRLSSSEDVVDGKKTEEEVEGLAEALGSRKLMWMLLSRGFSSDKKSPRPVQDEDVGRMLRTAKSWGSSRPSSSGTSSAKECDPTQSWMSSPRKISRDVRAMLFAHDDDDWVARIRTLDATAASESLTLGERGVHPVSIAMVIRGLHPRHDTLLREIMEADPQTVVLAFVQTCVREVTARSSLWKTKYHQDRSLLLWRLTEEDEWALQCLVFLAGAEKQVEMLKTILRGQVTTPRRKSSFHTLARLHMRRLRRAVF